MLVFANPAIRDLLERHWVKEMQFFPSTPDGDDQVRSLEQGKVLGHSLARHIEVLAKLTQSLAIIPVELVEQISPVQVGQGPKDFIHQNIMQPNGCMSSMAHPRS